MPLFEDASGLLFEYLVGADDETEFLWEEIFTRRSYMQHGIQVPTGNSAVVVDVGANIGLFSLAVLQENAEATIHAIEPFGRAFSCLERNLAAAPRARCHELLMRDRAGDGLLHCFHDAPAEATMHPREREGQRQRLSIVAKAAAVTCKDARNDTSSRGSGSSRGGGDSAEPPPQARAEVVRVRATTLSAFLHEHGLSRVDLLKVDVEGDELRVLLGVGSADWPSIQQVVMEVHDINGRLDACIHLLRRHGFRVTARASEGGVEKGYAMVIPSSLRLFYVYAVRGASQDGATEPAKGRKRKR